MRAHLLLSALLLLLQPALLIKAPAQTNQRNPVISNDTRSIAITASDRVAHQADVATLHIGFVLYGTDRETAYTAGTQASGAITKALLGAGIPEAAIESQDQSLAATDEGDLKPLPPDKRAARAFTIRQSWTVRADARDANHVLDLAIRAGANNSGQIEWSLRDPNAAQAEAATKAIQRARAQAAAMASGLGVKLGNLLYASNEVAAMPVPLAMARMTTMMAKGGPQPLSLSPQQIETSATVYAVFAIE